MARTELLKKPYCHSLPIGFTLLLAASMASTFVLYSLASVRHLQWVEGQLPSSSNSLQGRERIVVQSQWDVERRQSRVGDTERHTRVFEMEGSLSHFDIMEQILSTKVKCGNKSADTSLTLSRMKVTHVNEKTGETDVVIETYDLLGNKKTTGLDIIVVWATQKYGKSMASLKRIAGSVTDHINGSYTAKLVLPSTGFFTIYAKVLSIFRIQCLRFKAMHKYGNSVFSSRTPHGIHFIFRRGMLTDYTPCGPINRIHGYSELCNMTTLNHNYSYYCGKPRYGLLCSDFDAFVSGPYNLTKITVHRSKKDMIFNPGWGTLKQTVNLSIIKLETTSFQRNQTLPHCVHLPKWRSWNIAPSEVVVDNNIWKSSLCKTKSMDKTMIRQCLSNKTVLIVGDSTFRQYFDEAQSYVNGSLVRNPSYVTLTSKKDDINMTFHRHELPFHNRVESDPLQVRSVTDRIQTIADDATVKGTGVILGLTYNAHLQAFPPSVYRDRIKRLVEALKYLFSKKPEATVLFKGPNVANCNIRWFDVRIALMYSDIIFEEFSTIRHKVWYLDTFLISVVNDNMDLHPLGVALNNQLQQFLSYICD